MPISLWSLTTFITKIVSHNICLLYKLAFEGKIPLYYKLSKQSFRFYFVPTSPIPDSTNSPYPRQLSIPLTSSAFFLHSQFVNTSNRELSIWTSSPNQPIFLSLWLRGIFRLLSASWDNKVGHRQRQHVLTQQNASTVSSTILLLLLFASSPLSFQELESPPLTIRPITKLQIACNGYITLPCPWL